MDIHDIDTLKETFDLIWMSYSLLHIDSEKLSDVIQKAYRVLKSGGYWFIATAVSEKTQKVEAPKHIIGLSEDDNDENTLAYTRWARDDLVQLFEKYFRIKWEKIYANPFNNDTSEQSIVFSFWVGGAKGTEDSKIRRIYYFAKRAWNFRRVS